MEFRRVYKKRTDLAKYAMNDIAYGDRDRMVDAIMVAIREGASSASIWISSRQRSAETPISFCPRRLRAR